MYIYIYKHYYIYIHQPKIIILIGNMMINHGFFRVPHFQSQDELPLGPVWMRRLQLDQHFCGWDRLHLRSCPRHPERFVRPRSQLVLRHSHWLMLDLGWHSFFKDLGIAEPCRGLECGHFCSYWKLWNAITGFPLFGILPLWDCRRNSSFIFASTGTGYSAY